jgi:D-alanyl-lipoteichoic acid acyltransferase DltB (MBOAT superfamily)
MFYPQLVAGPIERPQNLLHQFREKHYFDYERVTDGLKLMAWGLFKKVVIADRLAIVVDKVYNNPTQYTGISFVIATVFFSFQIFCDFSGYSDMAIGAAQVMGFKLMKNFDRPYHSVCINEFWKRWHISLSTWFKDYLYISLGGNRVTIPRWYLNTFIVFLVSGLWHGASWTFVIWGAIHGFYLVFSYITRDMRDSFNRFIGLSKLPQLNRFIQIIITFALTNFAWIFFRANKVSDAFYIVKNTFTGFSANLSGVLENSKMGLAKSEIIIGITAVMMMELIHVLQYKTHIRALIKTQPAILRWSLYYAIILVIVYYGVYEKRQFIYFQF